MLFTQTVVQQVSTLNVYENFFSKVHILPPPQKKKPGRVPQTKTTKAVTSTHNLSFLLVASRVVITERSYIY